MKRVNLILLIDSSSSIKEKKLGVLVDATQNIVQMFQAICDSNPEIDGYIGSLTFNDNDLPVPKRVDEFEMVEPEFRGETRLGTMFKTLSMGLLSSVQFSSVGDYKNILVLLSDGGATDIFSDGFVEILQNPAFINSKRISVSIGDRINSQILSSFCTLSTDLFNAENIEPVDKVLKDVVHKFVSPKTSLKYERPRPVGDSEWD